jgi:PEP-CTERM motif
VERWIRSLGRAVATFLVPSWIALCSTSEAVPFAFTTDSRNLFRLDLGNATTTFLARLNFETFDLAVSPTTGFLLGTSRDGDLFGVTSELGFRLADFSSPVSGLDFLNNRRIGVESTAIGVKFAPPNTFSAIEIQPPNFVPRAVIRDTFVVETGSAVLAMAVRDSNTVLLNVLRSGSQPNELTTVHVSLEGARVTATSIIAREKLLFGLDFALDGNLYGVGLGGEVWRVDPDTGASNLVGTVGFDLFGLAAAERFPTFAPVPEPATLVLFGATMMGLGLTCWRRRMRN